MKIVDIKGPIIPSNDQWIYDWFGIEATSPKKVHDQLKDSNGQDLEVHINSGGGSVFDGSEIYTTLKDYKGNVTVKIVGLAASAASVIAMAGKKIMMSPTGQMMIHNVAASSDGDYHQMEQMANILKNANQTIANAYKLRTGKSNEELLQLMDNETWMTPQQAKEYGFIDEVMFDTQLSLVASAYISGLLPNEVLEKMRNEHFTKPPEEEQISNDFDQGRLSIMRKRLNLLDKL